MKDNNATDVGEKRHSEMCNVHQLLPCLLWTLTLTMSYIYLYDLSTANITYNIYNNAPPYHYMCLACQ